MSQRNEAGKETRQQRKRESALYALATMRSSKEMNYIERCLASPLLDQHGTVTLVLYERKKTEDLHPTDMFNYNMEIVSTEVPLHRLNIKVRLSPPSLMTNTPCIIRKIPQCFPPPCNSDPARRLVKFGSCLPRGK